MTPSRLLSMRVFATSTWTSSVVDAREQLAGIFGLTRQTTEIVDSRLQR